MTKKRRHRHSWMVNKRKRQLLIDYFGVHMATWTPSRTEGIRCQATRRVGVGSQGATGGRRWLRYDQPQMLVKSCQCLFFQDCHGGTVYTSWPWSANHNVLSLTSGTFNIQNDLVSPVDLVLTNQSRSIYLFTTRF